MKEKALDYIKPYLPEGNTTPDIVFQDDDRRGHYSTNVAFSIAKETGGNPMDIAKDLASKAKKGVGSLFFEKVEAVEPGFVNFWISPLSFHREVEKILSSGESYGENSIGKNKKARVEYVSANPTGPIHIGNARGGPYGEVLCRVFEKSGYSVVKEYFHNDIGNQVENLAETIWYWYARETGRKANFPEGGYGGEYPREIAIEAIKKFGAGLEKKDSKKLCEFALNSIFEENIDVLKKLGISFDLIVKESDLVYSGEVQQAIDSLVAKGVTKKADGALWFAPKDEFLEDREAVLVRSDGRPTYFASDVAYHRMKFQSESNLIIDIFGSNHHGHVPKLQALAKIYNFNSSKFLVLLYQFVRVKRGSEVVKMSKRAGAYITAKEVLEEVGPDSMIFSLLSTSPTTHIDFDIDAAKEQSMKNLVYYTQYAFVRAKSVLENAGVENDRKNLPLHILDSKDDIRLMRKLAQFPEVIRETAVDFHVHRLTKYAVELAGAFHNFYEKEKIIVENEEVKRARRALVEASFMVFKNLFYTLGISAPLKM